MLKKFEQLWTYLEEEVFKQPSTPTLFNQYKDTEPDIDKKNAHKTRRENLYNYLSSFKKKPEYILIGEAPGPNGCRFTGVPFTNEVQLLNPKLIPFAGKPTSNLEKPVSGLSAKIFWETLLDYHPRFLAWDCARARWSVPKFRISLS